MEEITLFVSVVIIIFGVLQIILFFKIWGMTNNVNEIKNIMGNLFGKDLHNNKKQKEIISRDSNNNVEINKEYFPEDSKFQEGDIVIYKPENIKLLVIGYISPNIFKCKTTDESNKTYCFQEDYLDKYQ